MRHSGQPFPVFAPGSWLTLSRSMAEAGPSGKASAYLTCSGACCHARQEDADVALEGHGLIFVSIVSFCDSETAWTIRSLFEASHAPSRIRVGVVWQVQRSPNGSGNSLDGDQRWPAFYGPGLASCRLRRAKQLPTWHCCRTSPGENTFAR